MPIGFVSPPAPRRRAIVAAVREQHMSPLPPRDPMSGDTPPATHDDHGRPYVRLANPVLTGAALALGAAGILLIALLLLELMGG